MCYSSNKEYSGVNIYRGFFWRYFTSFRKESKRRIRVARSRMRGVCIREEVVRSG